MTDQWHDDTTIVSAQIKHDDDDAPDDWEAELEEKPKVSDVEEKPKASVKAPATSKNKVSKKKYTDEDDSAQPDANEQLDQKSKEPDTVSGLVDKNGERQSLDNLNLISREEFLNYSLRLHNHLDIVSKSEFYPDFIDHFLNGITKEMSTDDVKRLSSTLQVITLRKQSEEREKKSKAKSKKPAKPQLKPVRQKDYGAFADAGDNEYDEEGDYDDDDFM